MESFESRREDKETPDFDLSISLTRHGPKQGHDGPLSEQGKTETVEYFSDAYKNISIDTTVERKVVASPKDRAIETAQMYQHVLSKDAGIEPLDIEIDEALNEGDIMKFVDSLEPEEKKDWFKLWYKKEREFPPGTPDPAEVIRNFSVRLLEEVENAKDKGGAIEIDAFSHGPLMGALLVYLEDCTGESLITDTDSADGRLNRERMLDLYKGRLRALQNVNFHIASKEPKFVFVTVLGKTIKVPLEVFRRNVEYEVEGGMKNV